MADPQKPSKAAEILAKLDALTASLRRPAAARSEDDEPIDPTDRHSMQGRIRELSRQRTEAEDALRAALASVAELRTIHAAELDTLRTEAATSVTAGVRRVEENYALRALMIEADDDGVAAAHKQYESMPENKRPSTIIEWFHGLDPEHAPKTLRAYLPVPVEAESSTTAPSAARQPPKVDVGRGKATEPDPATMDDAAYAAWLDGYARRQDQERIKA